MPLDLTKSPMLLSLLQQIIRQVSGLSQHDQALHQLLRSITQYIQHPQSVDGAHLNMALESLKDVVSSYSGHDKSLPNLFWSVKTELDFLMQSQRLSSMKVPHTAQLLLNIERLAKHGKRA